MELKYKTGLVVLLFFLASCFTKSENYKQNHVNRDVETVGTQQIDKPLKIMVISDLNDSYGSVTYSAEVTATIKRIKEIQPDIILCGGDMVAGQKSSLTEQEIKNMWDSFDSNVMKPIDELGIPFGFTMGNHDASPNFLKDRAAAKEYWNEHLKLSNLTFVDRTHYPFYFSFIKNNVFFMSWDASSAKVQPEVKEWMKEQLQSNVARTSRLRILVGHLPFYALVEAKNKPGEVIAEADEMFDFIKTHGVDVYISGHQHAYYPAQKEGVKLFNAGCIGSGPRPLIGHDEPAKKAYAILDIPVESPQEFKFNSFSPQNDEVIAVASLPDSIQGFNGMIKKVMVE